MLISLPMLIKKYDMKIRGVLHVGAHQAEELADYTNCGINYVVWVEGNKDLVPKLNKIVPSSHTVICAVVSDIEGEELVFHLANNGQSSSIFELGTHKSEHPEVVYIGEERRFGIRLDTIYEERNISTTRYNFLNLDIQGAELKALKSLGDRLDDFDYIYSEINKRELYKGCPMVRDLDRFLTDFQRVETSWTPHGWGDGFWIRK